MKTEFVFTIAMIIAFFNVHSQNAELLKDSRDNKIYKTVKIGDQTWMAENLQFKPTETGSEYWILFNRPENVDKFGYLYSFKTAQNVCPNGWKLPSKTNFETLINNAGKNPKSANKSLLPGGKSGFNSLKGGSRWYSDDMFGTAGGEGRYWTSTTNKQWGEYMFVNFQKKVHIYSQDKRSGFSVRCLKKE